MVDKVTASDLAQLYDIRLTAPHLEISKVGAYPNAFCVSVNYAIKSYGR